MVWCDLPLGPLPCRRSSFQVLSECKEMNSVVISCPQMYLLYKDPEGKTIFEKGTSGNNAGALAANLANKMEQEEMGERIMELEQLLDKVRRDLRQCDHRIFY